MDEPSAYQWGLTLALTAGGYVLTALYVPQVLFRKREPGATLAWLIVIVLFPYGGVLLYTLLGNSRVRSRSAAKQRADAHIVRLVGRLRETPEPALAASLEKLAPTAVRVADRLGLAPPTAGNALDLYTDGAAAFEALLAGIESARSHVHLEFFIFRHDGTGRRVLEALVAAARRGVEVRLLVDGVGALLTRTPARFFAPLRERGGEVARFQPVGPLRGWSVFNLRNHRKLVVMDGREAFTGGMNVGQEYAGLRDQRGVPWRDLFVRIRGPAAVRLQEVFAGDWYFATERSLADPLYFPALGPAGPDFVQVVASGPDDSLGRLHRLTLALIESAQRQLYITTPYFVPDPPLAMAIVLAALRGVDVRLLLPQRSNHPLAKWAGRSFYEELLEAGVQIHEYEAGMLHAKALVVDGHLSSVGSANMDIRSFRLNFELNTFVYGPGFASQIEERFIQDVLASSRLGPLEYAQRPLRQRVAETAARILSPVL